MLTPKHPRWEEFFARLMGWEEGIGFEYTPDLTHVSCRCPGHPQAPSAQKLLRQMGMDVLRSLAYFRRHDGHCDCEICLNCYVLPRLPTRPPCVCCGKPAPVGLRTKRLS